MTVRVVVGRDDFDSLIEGGGYYVDKTELLYDLVHGADNLVTLFTRPRRFGKTLALSMMESFFDITRDSAGTFTGLKIGEHAEFCARWMNQCPVLSISFKDVEGLSFEGAYGRLQSVIADVCKKHDHLASHPGVNRYDAEALARLQGQVATVPDAQSCLKTVMRMMHAVYGRRVVLLIDEYDVPLAKANEEKDGGERYYPQMLDVMRGLLGTALKSNEYLEFAVVTGCLRIAKESIFTGVNNFASYSVLDREFSQYFGFTRDEVLALLQSIGREGKADVFAEWYDGYVFGDQELYCPWDVVNYASALSRREDAQPKNYWKNTSGNGVIRDFVSRADFDVTGKFETLMDGGTITQTISDELTYDTLHETEGNLWSVLLMTGYLTKADPAQEGGTVALKIPNVEVASIFHDTVARLFSDRVGASDRSLLMNALWTGDERAASKAVSDLLWQTISYMDYHEDYYHAFLAGIFVGLGYEVESNRERGLGRPDVKLTDRAGRRVLVMEMKKARSKAAMDRACDEALVQIRDNEYGGNLDGYEVICYGVAFYQKTALVRKLQS